MYNTDERLEECFIEFIFTTNRMFLLKEFRPYYDELLKRYEINYWEGRTNNMDLRTINKKFMKIIVGSQI
jgi:hypothetical protein